MNDGIFGAPPPQPAARDARTIVGIAPAAQISNVGSVYNQQRRLESPQTPVDTAGTPSINIG